MKLASILKKYLIRGKTGQLVIKFVDEGHLCKIYIEDGNAVYVSMGNVSPEEVPDYISGKKPEEANFIEGVPPLKRLREPLNERLLNLDVAEGVVHAVDDIEVEGVVPPEKVEALVESFIDIVGPLGTMFAEKVFSNLGYTRGTEMRGEDYSVLLSSLLDEVPEAKREEFKKRNL